jgi:hypothetical protein
MNPRSLVIVLMVILALLVGCEGEASCEPSSSSIYISNTTDTCNV